MVGPAGPASAVMGARALFTNPWVRKLKIVITAKTDTTDEEENLVNVRCITFRG